ncbi:hypothetical protein F5X96DRAFT_666894 [Biscogniauxia mediterranea]|nr:hypothetical protein F5X96DRAFT_666894 [Biscogniauxia mediterranea]
MLSRALVVLSSLAVAAAAARQHPAAATVPHYPAAGPCTTGTPTVTGGYTITYAQAKPSIAFEQGYKPEPAWAKDHAVGSYTFGVPQPHETGFAYAQFKCQNYCNNNGHGGFFVSYAGPGSDCTCFDELLDPRSFVDNNQSLVGAWNPICK